MPNEQAASSAIANVIQSMGAMSEEDLRSLRRAIRQEMEKRGITPRRAARKAGGGGGGGRRRQQAE